MPALDGVEDIRSRLGSCPVPPSVHPLSFEPPKETFGCRIVGTTAHRAHATSNVVRRQELLVLVGGKLTAAIRVQNDWRPPRSLPHRHQHGAEPQGR
jgi:hypothetical protein